MLAMIQVSCIDCFAVFDERDDETCRIEVFHIFSIPCAMVLQRTCLLCCVACRQVLKARRPDVDSRRAGLLKLQGEFQARLRELEEQLLRELSSVSGNILDNDAIIMSLERLKKEAADVTTQVT